MIVTTSKESKPKQEDVFPQLRIDPNDDCILLATKRGSNGYTGMIVSRGSSCISVGSFDTIYSQSHFSQLYKGSVTLASE